MTIHKLISALLLSAAAAHAVAAAPGHEAITTQQVAAAMANVGMQISPKQVELLSDVVANTPAPALKIRSMEPMGDHRMMVRLDCAQPEQCVPFFVAVHFGLDSDARSASADLRTVSTNSDEFPSISHPRAAANAPTIRSGAPATLLIEGDHIHIRLAVVTLENGSVGQVIRVSSKDHKQVYSAEVIDGSVLRATL